jgi:hypothetical protein
MAAAPGARQVAVVNEALESRAAARFESPERPTFLEELWLRAEQAERRAVRRWRVAAIGGAAAALTAASAAGVLAFSGAASARVVDMTVVCTANDLGGVNAFNVNFEAGKGIGIAGAVGTFSVWTPNAVFYPGYTDTSNRWHAASKLTAVPAICRPARKIPLARAALPLHGQSSAPGYDKLQCWVTRAVFRARVTFDAKGAAIATTFAMRNARTGKPVAFAKVTTKRIVDYAADACLHD